MLLAPLFAMLILPTLPTHPGYQDLDTLDRHISIGFRLTTPSSDHSPASNEAGQNPCENVVQGISITDTDRARGLLAFDLRDILDVVGEAVDETEWALWGVECMGGAAADEMHRTSEMAVRIRGRQLREMARAVDQIIDGTFSGFHAGDQQPWIVIRAIDSTAFDVLCDNPQVLANLRAHFREAREILE